MHSRDECIPFRCIEGAAMKLTSKFTIAVHILTAIEYFGNTETVTSQFLAGSIGANPVIVRNIVGDLKKAGMIDISRGKSGMSLAENLKNITLYDVYKAVNAVAESGLFHFHESPNEHCPVGRHIHEALGGKLSRVQTAMEEELRRMTVADVAGDLKRFIAAEA